LELLLFLKIINHLATMV